MHDLCVILHWHMAGHLEVKKIDCHYAHASATRKDHQSIVLKIWLDLQEMAEH